MATATATVDPMVQIVAELQAQIKALETRLAVAGGAVVPASPEELASSTPGSVEALALVTALETAISSKSYVDSMAVVDVLRTIVKTF